MGGRAPFARAALLCAVICLAVPPKAPAQQAAGELYYGIDLSVAAGVAVPNTDEFGSAFYIRAGAGYQVSEHFALGVGLGRFSTTIDHEMDTPPPNTVADGDLTAIPLTLDFRFRYNVPELFGTLYATAGVGYYFMDYSWNGLSKEYFREVEALYGTASQDVEDTFGFSVGGGFEYPLTAQVILAAEGQYLFLSPTASGEWRDLITGEPFSLDKDIDLNTWLFSLGIKYFF